MEPRVLILDGHPECPPGLVETRLVDKGVPVAVLSLDKIVKGESVVSYSIEEMVLQDERSGREFSSTSLASVWAENLSLPRNPEATFRQGAGLEQTLEATGLSEAIWMTRSLIAALAFDRLFLPRLMDVKRARFPLFQRALGKKCGFDVPPVYAGSDVGRMMRVLEVGERDLIHYHPLSEYPFTIKGRTFVPVDRFIDAKRRFALANIKAPAVFSRWPAYRARFVVAIVGAEVFALEVALEDESLDPDVTDVFYQHAQDNLHLRRAELPAAARRLCEATGLRFATLEILQGEGDRFTLLSVDPAGRMHLFDEAGWPATDRLVDWLSEGEGAR